MTILPEEPEKDGVAQRVTQPRGRKWVRQALLLVIGLLVLAIVALVAGLVAAERKMHRRVEVVVQGVPLVTEPAALERGRYLFASRGCADCHGSNGAGRLFLDDGRGLRIAGPNISPGPGSVVSGYTPQDWERTIRHGVGPSGRPLMVMPSEDYNRWSNEDLAAVVAWVRSLPPANGGGPTLDLPIPVRVAYGFGLMQDAAAKIDHALPVAAPVPEAITLERGAYVANMCVGCHGATLSGGKIPGAPPDWPAAANLRSGTAIARYDAVDTFRQLFKTGQRPDGSAVKVMPFESLREMSETDVRALHMYLQSLKPALQQ